MDMGARAVGVFTARSMGPTVPAARQVTTGDVGEEPTATVNGQVADARMPESAAAADASLNEDGQTASGADPRSWVNRR